MEVKSEDICIILGSRLTEYKIYDGEGIVYTYFNIRDEQGTVHGRNYGDIETPLDIIIRMLSD